MPSAFRAYCRRGDAGDGDIGADDVIFTPIMAQLLHISEISHELLKIEMWRMLHRLLRRGDVYFARLISSGLSCRVIIFTADDA